MLEPPVPLLVEPGADALLQAALELEEDAASLRRNPVPETWDHLRGSIAGMKRAIADAEREWGL